MPGPKKAKSVQWEGRKQSDTGVKMEFYSNSSKNAAI
jgi:hypothetical protein